jgi:hypothetical protein
VASDKALLPTSYSLPLSDRLINCSPVMRRSSESTIKKISTHGSSVSIPRMNPTFNSVTRRKSCRNGICA